MKKINIMPIAKIVTCIVMFMILTSCESKVRKPPIPLKSHKNKEIVVPYKELAGLPTIPVKINGVSMQMIYDTGASHIVMSLNEVITLLKNGALSEYDIIGSDYATIADGNIVENVKVRLREVEIGGEDGIKVNNVEALIVANLDAPLLLGRSAIKDNNVASISIDNEQQAIVIKRK